MLNKYIREAIKNIPEVVPHLTFKARLHFDALDLPEYKSAEMYQNRIEKQVTELYEGGKDDTFVEEMMLLIAAYLLLAYRQAWQDEGGNNILPESLSVAWRAKVLEQYAFVQQYHDDIITARQNKQPIDPLIARAELWAARWNESYNEANLIIANETGLKMEWIYGDTDHCDTCRNLNGIVATAEEWRAAGVVPQAAPNDKLECGGWKCQCQLTITTKRRTPKAVEKINRALYG